MSAIAEYIAGFPPDVQKVLKRIHSTIRRIVPKAEESISYRIPTFKVDGRPLVYFAGFKAHVSLYPVTTKIRERFAKELTEYETSTGTVRFSLDEPIPYPLIGRIVKVMAEEQKKRPKKTR